MTHDNLLAGFSTCEISDALIKLNIPHGGHIPDIHMISPLTTSGFRICSPAYTVKMVLASDKDSPSLSDHFVDTAPAGSVIVIDAPEESKNAVWGGLMSAGAQARGVVGVIISGRCRDISEHRSLAFPVFVRGHSTLGQSSFTRPSAINVPLAIFPEGAGCKFPAVTVYPNDWMIADEDGVVCVPNALQEQVVKLAKKGRQIDSCCMKDIKAGKGVKESFKVHRGQ